MNDALQSFLPADAVWAGAVLIIIAAVFLAAATIGTVARATSPEMYVEPVMIEAEAGAPIHPEPEEL